MSDAQVVVLIHALRTALADGTLERLQPLAAGERLGAVLLHLYGEGLLDADAYSRAVAAAEGQIEVDEAGGVQ